MAAYNGEQFIAEQITSICNQLLHFDELIISDDGSTDRTLAIVKSFNNVQIKVVNNTLDKGYSGNFENAISHAAGEIIFLSDQDDIWVDGKLEKMVNALSSAELVVCDAQFVDANLVPTEVTLFNLRGGGQGFLRNLCKSRYLGACMAFKRSILKKILPFPHNKTLCPHDYWISLVCEFYFSVILVNEPLILYRRHKKNTSTGGMQSGNNLITKLLVRCYALTKVTTRLFK